MFATVPNVTEPVLIMPSRIIELVKDAVAYW